MTRPLRCLKSFSELSVSPPRCIRLSLNSPHTPGIRGVRHAATATANKPPEDSHFENDFQEQAQPLRRDRPPKFKREYLKHNEALPYPRASRRTTDPAPIVSHLEELFPPLKFPPVLATRMVTHISAREAPWDGHNARLSFVGRRVLETYLNLFLHSVPRSELPSGFEPDYVFIAHRALHTPVLGEYVGTQWRLRDIMQWTPARGFEETARVEERRQLPDTRLLSKNVGFYKVQGIAVEGIIGGIFHQFGGTVAHRVFHTRLLPHILCPGSPVGLPDHYHDFVNKVLLKMGGSEALLSGSNTRTSRTPKLADGVSAAVEAS